jgi:putative acetyltransferase
VGSDTALPGTGPAIDPVVRPEAPGDDVLQVVAAAFAEEGERVRTLWEEVADSAFLHGSLVAELDGRVVGHVGLSHAWVDARRALVDVWMLSPLSVLPELQGRGIGTRLVEAAIGSARDGGAPLLLLEGDPGYYGRRGFEPAAAYGLSAPSARTPAPAFQVVPLAGREDWMTGRVVYPDVWWRHESAGLRDPELARVEALLSATHEEDSR